ncbi:MAG: tyrosine-type recombinase/integrase [Nitrospinae bacterium]|nr:tyrosine-type recombinase/integrase [Nitrospinota bacterium]
MLRFPARLAENFRAPAMNGPGSGCSRPRGTTSTRKTDGDAATTETTAASQTASVVPAVVATPHIAASTDEAQKKVAVQIVDQVVRALRGDPVTTPVNAGAMRMASQPEVAPYINLAERLGCLGAQLVEGSVERITVDELLDDVISDYEANGKAVERVRLSARTLKRFFGGMRASQITTEDIMAYIARRQSTPTPPANATINRELAALRRMLHLAAKATPPRRYKVPHGPMLREDNVRQGFVEYEEYLAIKAAAPDYLKGIITMAFYTGCRRGEILSLKWSQVDLHRRLIRLNPGETKNREGRVVYMAEELYEALAELKAQRDWSWPDCESVFTRSGEPIKSFKKAWRSACKRVGLEDLLFHDLRRSAVRNLIRSGVPERVAMAISGHKTRSIFDRYNITSESDLEQAARSLDAFHASVGTNLGTIEGFERALEEVQGGK